MNIWSSLRGLPRDMWILALASLINRAGTMVLPFLVLYLTRELGFAPARAGFALAVFGAGAIIAAPIAGTLSDRIGPLPIMRWSLILTGILLLIYPHVRGFTAVLAITVAWAVTTEAFRPASLALIADIVTPAQRKPAYALIRLAINIGMSIGPAAAGFIAARSFQTIFIVDGITTIAAGIVLILAPLSHIRHQVADRDTSIRASIGRLLVRDDPRLRIFLTAVFLTGVVFFQHEGALALFLVNDLGLSPTFFGLLFTINTLMIVFMEVPLNAATAHWPHHRALSLGAFFFAIGSGAFAFASGPPMVIAGIVIWTVGEMMLFPQAAAFVAEIAPVHRRGEYMGSYSLAFNLAFAIAPWAGTAALARFGAQPLWISVFIVGVVSGILMLRVNSVRAAYLSTQ